MVTKDNNKDEELLILSDDTDSDFKIDEDIIIDDDSNLSDSLISFDDEKNEDTSKNKLIEDSDDFSFSFDDSSEKTELESKDEKSTENTNLDLWDDLSFSLDDSETIVSDLNTDKSELNSFSLDTDLKNEDTNESIDSNLSSFNFEEKVEEKVEEKPSEDLFATDKNIETDNIDFNESQELEESEWSEIWTMTDILSEAISKAEKRKLLIESDIDSREKHISDLKKEISDLENNVWLENEEVSKLNSEKQSILKNIKSLEKMKTDMNLPIEAKK